MIFVVHMNAILQRLSQEADGGVTTGFLIDVNGRGGKLAYLSRICR